MQLTSPDELVDLLQNLQLSESDKKKLNNDLANKTRRYFRAQISAQKDLAGKSYAPRKRRPITMAKSGKIKSNKNMLMGLSRMLKTESDANGFSVGLAGLAAKVGRVHNDGQTVTFPKRMHGWFDSKTNTWKGGTKSKGTYTMPKRPFIGWNKELIQSLQLDIINSMEPIK